MTTATAPVQADVRPSELAEAITGRRYLSWSQINSFRSCPRAFTFKYVENIAPAFISSSLLFGGAIHSAIQTWFEHRFEGADVSVDDLVESYRVAWRERLEEQGGVPVRYGKGEDADSLAQKARDMLEAFVASPLAEPAGDLVAVEERLSGSIADDLPDLLAIVDLIWSDDDGLHVMDFKTSRSKWTDVKVAEASHQLRLYARLARSLAERDVDVHLHFGVLVKTKSPTVQTLDVPAVSDQDEKVANLIRPVWRAMTLGVDYGNPSATACSGCPFRRRCPAVSSN